MHDLIQFLIDDENEAIKGYDDVIDKIDDAVIKAQLVILRDEEIQHRRVLERMLNNKRFTEFRKVD